MGHFISDATHQNVSIYLISAKVSRRWLGYSDRQLSVDCDMISHFQIIAEGFTADTEPTERLCFLTILLNTALFCKCDIFALSLHGVGTF